MVHMLHFNYQSFFVHADRLSMNVFMRRKQMFFADTFSYDPQDVSSFLDKSTEAEEEEPTSGNSFTGNEKCILSKAVYDQRVFKMTLNSVLIIAV